MWKDYNRGKINIVKIITMTYKDGIQVYVRERNGIQADMQRDFDGWRVWGDGLVCITHKQKYSDYDYFSIFRDQIIHR